MSRFFAILFGLVPVVLLYVVFYVMEKLIMSRLVWWKMPTFIIVAIVAFVIGMFSIAACRELWKK